MRSMLTMALAAVLVLTTGCSLIDRMTGVSEIRVLQGIGKPAEAEILRVWDTGTTVNEDPVIGMEVEVRPAEGDPYRATIAKTWVSRIDIPSFQPGAVIPVRYDPLHPERVAFDNAPPQEGATGTAPGLGVETSVSFGLKLCARSTRSEGGDGKDLEALFVVTGPEEHGFEARKTVPANDDWICAQFPEDFGDATAVPGSYRYQIRVNSKTVESGGFDLRR
jgi:hypothetical protein